MKYIKSFIVAIFLLTSMFSCDKEADDLMEYQPYTNRFVLIDSVIEVINTFEDSSVTTHYPMNREIEVLFSHSQDFIIFEKDTFMLNGGYGYLFQGGMPIINFKNDSISIKKKLGGIGIQTWEYKYGIKKY